MTQVILSAIGVGLLLAIFTELFFLMLGRKKGDSQIINDLLRRINNLTKRNEELAKENEELKAYRDVINGILKNHNYRDNKKLQLKSLAKN